MSVNQLIRLTDCPRDAIQGLKQFIPTHRKIAYVNSLIASELFDFIDFGSFVSPKAVPQLADTVSVLEGIDRNSSSKLIAIIATEQGAREAGKYEKIDYLGYPFSVSDTCQRRNTNRSIEQACTSVKGINDILYGHSGSQLMIYISMAFGNPYGDQWDEDIVLHWMQELKKLGVKKFSIADTTSSATVEQVETLFTRIKSEFNDLELSVHL